MCGINGIIDISGDSPKQSILEEMNKVVQHRGPDSNGVYVDGKVGLGHVRLSILDLSYKGKQPMRFEDWVISYNGEIYNFRDIKKELETIGYTFISQTDTEVVLKAFREWNESALEKFNGMFAFIIYNRTINKVWIVRDRLGIKPLYFYSNDNLFVVSSEIRAIKIYPEIKLTIDYNSIDKYLNYLYIPCPYTMSKEVHKLDPGHYLVIDLNNRIVDKQQYWKLKVNEINRTLAEDINDVKRHLINSIEKRLISDVPIGAFLSGGIDSSLICSIAHKELGKTLDTFSIGYDDSAKLFDETDYARRVAKKYNTNHTAFQISFDEVFSEIEDVLGKMEEPNADTSVFLNYYISKKTRESVIVALSGLGGDELFGGYNRYQAYLLGIIISKVPSLLRKSFVKVLDYFPQSRNSFIGNKIRVAVKILNSSDRNLDMMYHNMISYVDRKSEKISDYDIHAKNGLNHILKFDIEKYMVDDLLELTDKMSMANALEVRVPFLDHGLVSRAFEIPQQRKTTISAKKILLKKLAENYLENDIIYRRKQGFSAPIEVWFNTKSIKYFESIIYNENLEQFVDASYINDVLQGYYIHKRDNSLQLYALLVLAYWLKRNR